MMNYTARLANHPSGIGNRSFAHRSIVEEKENVEALIDDTIRMIENTQRFLDRLDHSQAPARKHMEEMARRLERSLNSLRQRKNELGRIC